MQHLDEGTIHAWLDGALPPAESDDIARHVAECGECGERVAEARGVIAGASRIVSALDIVRGDVIPANQTAAPGSLWRRLHLTPARAALAASVLIAVSALLAVRHDTPGKMVLARTPDTAKAAPTVALAPPVTDTAPAPAVAASRVAEPQRKNSRVTVPPVAVPIPSAPERVATNAKAAEVRVARADSLAVDSVRANRSYDVTRRASAPAAVAGNFAGGAQNQLRALQLSDVVVQANCYQLVADSVAPFKNLPERFMLQRDDEGRNIVRAVTAQGKGDSVLVGSVWSSRAAGIVAVRFMTPAPVTLTLAPTTTFAQASSGAEHRNLSVRRMECRP